MYKYGSGPNSSDAYTINGLPGLLYPCSIKGKIIALLPNSKHTCSPFLNNVVKVGLNRPSLYTTSSWIKSNQSGVKRNLLYSSCIILKSVLFKPDKHKVQVFVTSYGRGHSNESLELVELCYTPITKP